MSGELPPGRRRIVKALSEGHGARGLATQKPGLVRLASPQLLTLTVGIATLHRDRDLHDALAAALAEIMNNGEYQRILGKWGFEAMAIK